MFQAEMPNITTENSATFLAATTNQDWDNDSVTNYKELEIGTNPFDNDSDNDGLADGVEYRENIDLYLTDPLNPDTDGDGLLDGEEFTQYYTHPLIKDTDGDRLSDGVEVKYYGTNPLSKDSDNDGVNDYIEIINGTDPKSAKSY